MINELFLFCNLKLNHLQSRLFNFHHCICDYRSLLAQLFDEQRQLKPRKAMTPTPHKKYCISSFSFS